MGESNCDPNLSGSLSEGKPCFAGNERWAALQSEAGPRVGVISPPSQQPP